MQKVAIVTDGSCDLSQELIEKYNIHIAPFQVIFDTESYQLYGDSGDITKEEFYQRLEAGPDLPSTAIPTPKSTLDAFEAAASEADEVIGIFLSTGLSGAYQSAKRVVEMIENANITLIDSKVSASCLGLLVLEAAKKAQKGERKNTIVKHINELIADTRLVVVVDTMEYLYRGGRIGRAKKFFGKALNIKPILHFEDGVVASGGTLRGREEVIKRLKFAAPFIVENSKTDYIFIWHTRDLQNAKELQKIMLEHNSDDKQILIQEAGPVIGTHVGPKSLGFTYIGNYNSDWLLKMKN